MSDKFIGNKLRLMRLFYGLSQDDLGLKVTASRQYIQQIESGIKYPNGEFINVLSDALDVNPTFFFTLLESEVREEQCHFRRRRTTRGNTIKQIISHATLFDKLVSLINSRLNLPKIDFPFKSPTNLMVIEEIAEECRKHWKLGIDAPINSMMRVNENAGAVVTYFTNDSGKVDALSINCSRPIILLNYEKEMNAARIRFDLAHECGHLVMHQGIETGDYKTEEEANRFASAFLLPRKAFVQEFPQSGKRLNWTEIYKMKLRWKTSVSAIIRRAVDLRLIDSMQYRRANIYLSKSGQTKSEMYDEEIERESPELLSIAVNALEKTFKISLEDIGSKLNLKSASISKLTGMPVESSASGVISYLERYKFINE